MDEATIRRQQGLSRAWQHNGPTTRHNLHIKYRFDPHSLATHSRVLSFAGKCDGVNFRNIQENSASHGRKSTRQHFEAVYG